MVCWQLYLALYLHHRLPWWCNGHPVPENGGWMGRSRLRLLPSKTEWIFGYLAFLCQGYSVFVSEWDGTTSGRPGIQSGGLTGFAQRVGGSPGLEGFYTSCMLVVPVPELGDSTHSHTSTIPGLARRVCSRSHQLRNGSWQDPEDEPCFAVVPILWNNLSEDYQPLANHAGCSEDLETWSYALPSISSVWRDLSLGLVVGGCGFLDYCVFSFLFMYLYFFNTLHCLKSFVEMGS